MAENVSVFEKKGFNPQAFGEYIQTIEKTRENALLKANIFRSSQEVRDMFSHQSTTAYGVIPVVGRFEGTAQNYDGMTDLEGDSLDTYYYGVHSYGRAIVGTEKDFTKDLIPGLDPLDQIAKQFADRWDDVNEDTLISIIKGIFASSTTAGQEFATNHTFTISSLDNVETAIYDATQQACGDKNKKFSLCITHSKIATELAKKQLLEYVKYTNPAGIQMNTNIAQWGDKMVLVDDYSTIETSDSETTYITYVLGEGAFIREPLPVDQAFERDRNALKNGGTTNLISRERQVLHPYGFSYSNENQASLSPTDTEFEDGARWDLMKCTDSSKSFSHKLIPIVKMTYTVA